MDVTVGTTDVPCPISGIQGTTETESPSTGSCVEAWVTVTLATSVPWMGGRGEVQTSTLSAPVALATVTSGQAFSGALAVEHASRGTRRSGGTKPRRDAMERCMETSFHAAPAVAVSGRGLG